jgi:hypothetical protein
VVVLVVERAIVVGGEVVVATRVLAGRCGELRSDLGSSQLGGGPS